MRGKGIFTSRLNIPYKQDSEMYRSWKCFVYPSFQWCVWICYQGNLQDP